MPSGSLLDFATAGGCAGKACQKDLYALLRRLPWTVSPRLLVGGETADDAGIYQLSRHRALVLTVDILGPIADAPFTFGQIAAANSLSDVYAMGGRPLATLAVLGFPPGKIDHQRLRTILAGAISKIREAGAVLAGGHTFQDQEIKFGLAVIGTIQPERVVTNTGARPGDRLILTKPPGTGIITTALKAGRAPSRSVRIANRLMTTLNDRVAGAMVRTGVSAATDITGFGLLGHAWELTQASGVNLVIEASSVPLIPGTVEMAQMDFYPQGTLNNYGFVRKYTRFRPGISRTLRLILCDAQTSGGLLISVAESKASRLLNLLQRSGTVHARIIGRVEKGKGSIIVK
uniref:Selenide, water dikinase n=1 Tax=candidate division WOR-3 bacterium TaxID=2052148 RepID=A0A7C1NDG1_UNCW3